MGALDVVALVEGVKHDLPVGRKDRRTVRAEPQLLKVIGRQPAGEGPQEFEERFGLEIHVDEHEAAPPIDECVAEPGLGLVHRREVVPIDHLGVAPVEVPTPRVIPAPDLGGGEVPGPVGQARAPVAAGVVEGLDGVSRGPHDQDRLVADHVFQEVADAGDLLLAARHLPDVRPELLHLQVEELLRDVALLGDNVGLRGLEQVPPRSIVITIGLHPPLRPRRPLYSDSRIPECYSRLRGPEGMRDGRNRPPRPTKHEPHRRRGDLEDQGGEPTQARQPRGICRPGASQGVGHDISLALARAGAKDGGGDAHRRAGQTWPGTCYSVADAEHTGGRWGDCVARRCATSPTRPRSKLPSTRVENTELGPVDILVANTGRPMDGKDLGHPAQALGAVPPSQSHGHVPRHPGSAAFGHGEQARLAHRHHHDRRLPRPS